jgi:hypothetical protein
MVLDLKTQEESTVVNTEIPSDPTTPIEEPTEIIDETEEVVEDIVEETVEPEVNLEPTAEEKSAAILEKNIKKFQEKQRRVAAERTRSEKAEAQRHLSDKKKAEMDAKERADKKANDQDTIKARRDSARLAEKSIRDVQIARHYEYVAQKEFEKSNTPENKEILRVATKERVAAEKESERLSTIANDAKTRLKLANWRL